jgi:hypothetical protein
MVREVAQRQARRLIRQTGGFSIHIIEIEAPMFEM